MFFVFRTTVGTAPAHFEMDFSTWGLDSLRYLASVPNMDSSYVQSAKQELSKRGEGDVAAHGQNEEQAAGPVPVRLEFKPLPSDASALVPPNPLSALLGIRDAG